MAKWLNEIFRRAPNQGLLLQDADYVVLDTELSGLDRKRDRILSIGAIRMHGTSILLSETFDTFIYTDPSHAEPAVRIHEILPSDLSEGLALADALKNFTSQFVRESDVLVGHFLNIDLDFLQRDLKALKLPPLTHAHIDTMNAVSWLDQAGYSVARQDDGSVATQLFDIARAMEIEVDEAHNALADAYITARVWQQVQSILSEAGKPHVNNLAQK